MLSTLPLCKISSQLFVLTLCGQVWPPQLPMGVLRGTRMWRRNTWNVVCGDTDQGLFAHVFVVLLQGRTLAFPTKHGDGTVSQC